MLESVIFDELSLPGSHGVLISGCNALTSPPVDDIEVEYIAGHHQFLAFLSMARRVVDFASELTWLKCEVTASFTKLDMSAASFVVGSCSSEFPTSLVLLQRQRRAAVSLDA